MNAEWDNFILAQKGDNQAWNQLVKKYQPKLTALAFMITGSETAALDIVQDTFIRASSAKIKIGAGTVSGYLGTIAYRLAVKEVKNIKKFTDISKADLLAEDTNQLDKILNSERDTIIAEAIQNLESNLRDVLLLKCYGCHSYEEISKLLDIPLGTVKSRIFYAMKTVREKLQKKGIIE